MKETITTGEYTRQAGHSYRNVHQLTNLKVGEDQKEVQHSIPLSGLEKFCEKYKKVYCESCRVENCQRRNYND